MRREGCLTPQRCSPEQQPGSPRDRRRAPLTHLKMTRLRVKYNIQEILGDTVIATVILDRLLHHSHVINIRGESYRLKDKRQSGLLTSTAEETQMEG